MKPQARLICALVLSVVAVQGTFQASPSTAPAAPPPAQTTGVDAAQCPLRGADLDKLTPYRWQVAQYKAERGFIPNAAIKIDYCELVGRDDKGAMKTGLMVNIAKGPHAAAFAKHWRDVCAQSLMREARGKVEPVPGVAGGYQCVTPAGRSSAYWLEATGRTIQLEPEDDPAEWAGILPKVLAAVARD